MAAARHCTSWADLPPELLGLVLKRLSSLADRVRLAAVCRPWRHSAQLEPLPQPFPWITRHDTTFLDVLDGKIYCLPSLVPSGNSLYIGSVGNWLFLKQHTNDRGSLFSLMNYTNDRGSLLSLMNPFSKDVMQFPNTDTIWCECYLPENNYPNPYFLVKVVLLSSMDPSPDSLFAVHVKGNMSVNVISICQPSTASAFCVLHYTGDICDVAFIDEKLYALSTEKLFVYEVKSKRKAKRKFPSMKCIANDVIHPTTVSGEHFYTYFIYLVESSGKLLLVQRLVENFSLSPEIDIFRTFSFEVFEIDFTTSSSSVQWIRLNSLEGKAVFLGPNSKALHASEYGAQADCIYFMCDHSWTDYSTGPLYDSGVFNMRNGTITPLLPENMVTQTPENIAKGSSTNKFRSAYASWFFPS